MKAPPLEMVLQWFEVTTGYDADQSVGDTRVLRDLLEKLRDDSRKLGRRSRDLLLPVDWQAQGIYQVVVQKGEVFLQNRWSKQGSAFHGVSPGADGKATHMIDMNWFPDAGTSKLCISVLGLSLAHPLVAVGSTPNAKRRRTTGSDSSTAGSLLALEAGLESPSPPLKTALALEYGQLALGMPTPSGPASSDSSSAPALADALVDGGGGCSAAAAAASPPAGGAVGQARSNVPSNGGESAVGTGAGDQAGAAASMVAGGSWAPAQPANEASPAGDEPDDAESDEVDEAGFEPKVT